MHQRTDRPDSVPADPFAWRPQVPRITRKAPAIKDPVLEPIWSGTRVLAHFEADTPAGTDRRRLRLIDEAGTDVSDREQDVVDELESAIVAFDAIIDGILTTQATRGGEGASIVHTPQVSRGSVFLPRDAGIDVQSPPPAVPGVVAFVGVDLLRVDGQALFDVPLLERKRVLESIVRQTDRVRVSIFTRPPVDPWLASWKSTGFKGAMLKAANSRYVPGGYSEEWTTVTRLQQRR